MKTIKIIANNYREAEKKATLKYPKFVVSNSFMIKHNLYEITLKPRRNIRRKEG